MASITKQKGGNRTIQFVAAGGRRKSIRLGKVSQRQAESFKFRVEQLIAAQRSGVPVDADTSEWLVVGQFDFSRLFGWVTSGSRSTISSIDHL